MSTSRTPARKDGERQTAGAYVVAVVVIVIGASDGVGDGANVFRMAGWSAVGVLLAYAAFLSPRFPLGLALAAGIVGMVLLEQTHKDGVYVWPGALVLGATLAMGRRWSRRHQSSRQPPPEDL